MVPRSDLSMRVSSCLWRRFGPHLMGPYWQSKVTMARHLVAALRLSQQDAFDMVEELEGRGELCFEHLVWRAAPTLRREEGARAVPLERGRWKLVAEAPPSSQRIANQQSANEADNAELRVGSGVA